MFVNNHPTCSVRCEQRQCSSHISRFVLGTIIRYSTRSSHEYRFRDTYAPRSFTYTYLEIRKARMDTCMLPDLSVGTHAGRPGLGYSTWKDNR